MAALEALGAAPPASHRAFPWIVSVAQPRLRRREAPGRAVWRRPAEKNATAVPHSAASASGATISARNGRVSTSAASAEAGGCAAIGSPTAGLGSAGAAATAVSDSPSTTTGPMTRARPVRVIGHLHLL